MAVGFANNEGIGRIQELCIGHNLKEGRVVAVMGENVLKSLFPDF